VAKTANKVEIKQAVEHLFKVTVLNVRTTRVRGKVKRLGRFQGRRPDWKKAIATLKEGDSIELYEGV
jgi:large subunit ribosomal protein L23